ncbi:MAG: 16S rRNA (cytosine(1402)-N(4))-methyltransferase RsmH [Geobacteraceae bacterium]|nr:16S rRNA (cytosine(1402)-N(4))-methyltransferase RsmH [Geobacteraceae bacterium]
MADFRHISVLYEEVLQYLEPRSGGVYVDGTLGGGGHARGILECSAPDGILLGFDRDQEALAAAGLKLSAYGNRVRLFHENYSNLTDVLAREEIESIDGMVLDVGVSSHQLDKAERGFSFQQDAQLDMRMDGSAGRTAADLVNILSEKELEQILWEFGEERWARRIASMIVAARDVEPISTTSRLVDIVKGAIPRACWEARLHPATRTFQALRIAVNEELKSLERGLVAGIESLKKGGRIVVISFHSLEDRIVKNVFNEFARGCICPKSVPRCVCGKVPVVRKLTGRPVVAGSEEIAANSRSRSAKLRAAEKL